MGLGFYQTQSHPGTQVMGGGPAALGSPLAADGRRLEAPKRRVSRTKGSRKEFRVQG